MPVRPSTANNYRIHILIESNRGLSQTEKGMSTGKRLTSNILQLGIMSFLSATSVQIMRTGKAAASLRWERGVYRDYNVIHIVHMYLAAYKFNTIIKPLPVETEYVWISFLWAVECKQFNYHWVQSKTNLRKREQLETLDLYSNYHVLLLRVLRMY